MRKRRDIDWTTFGDLPSQRIVLDLLPPTTNHGYALSNIGGRARMRKTRPLTTWKQYAQAELDCLDLKAFQGRVGVSIGQFVADFRSDVDGRIKFVLDALQRQAYRNDNQVDIYIPFRIRVDEGDERLVVDVFDLGDFEIQAFDVMGVRLLGAGWRGNPKPPYNNGARRRGA